MANAILSYKGYHTKPEYSLEDGVIHGKIEGLSDLVSFESESTDPDAIRQAFQESVDEYIAFCEEVGKAPEKEYIGTFNVRISPKLHRSLAQIAYENETSLNQEVENAIRFYLTERESSMIEATASKSPLKVSRDYWNNSPLKKTLQLINRTLPSLGVVEG